MKILAVIFLAVLLSGCGGKVVLKDGPCDPHPSRAGENLCPDDSVLLDCQFVPKHGKSVCVEK